MKSDLHHFSSARFELVDASAISRLMTSLHEIDTMKSILTPLMENAMDLQKQYKSILSQVITKLSKGVASLPNEVLAMVFGFAVRAEGHRGSAQAKSLSHVSRRFRTIALAERNLWTVLRSDASKKELKTFISRSGTQADLNIFIHVPRWDTNLSWETFEEICLPTTSRWQTVTLGNLSRGCIAEPSLQFDDDFGRIIGHEVKETLCSLHDGDAQFPRLHELDILCHHINSISTSLSWTSPNLHSLRCFYHLPYPSDTLSTVTTFVYKLYITHYKPTLKSQELLEFLLSMSNLSRFDLTLGNTDCVELKRPVYYSLAFCPSIRTFHLRLPGFKMTEGREAFIAGFLKALQMPNLEDFSISIGLRVMEEDESKHAELLSGLSVALFPTHFDDNLSRLSSLSFLITHEPDPTDDTPQNVKNFPKMFIIPLGRVPTVSTLVVTTCTQITFNRECHARPNGKKLKINSKPSCLREIRFCGCEDLNIGDLRIAVHSLKGIGYWGALEKVTIEDCSALNYKEAVAVVGKEKLHYLT